MKFKSCANVKWQKWKRLEKEMMRELGKVGKRNVGVAGILSGDIWVNRTRSASTHWFLRYPMVLIILNHHWRWSSLVIFGHHSHSWSHSWSHFGHQSLAVRILNYQWHRPMVIIISVNLKVEQSWTVLYYSDLTIWIGLDDMWPDLIAKDKKLRSDMFFPEPMLWDDF